MKSFLASLAARAHGLAEVVQPRPRALFEPDATGDAEAGISDVPAAVSVRTSVNAAVPAERPLARRIVEVERLLAVAMPTAPGPVNAVLPPEQVQPVTEVVVPVPAVPTATESSAVVAAVTAPPPATPPVVPTVVPPSMRVPRPAPAPKVPPKGAAASKSEPAPSAPPNVTIRIERIDVRAVPPAMPLARTVAAVRRANAKPSLGDYLSARP